MSLVARVRDELKRRGAGGIIGLGRKFRIMDDDGNKSLNMYEFTKAMRECELNLADHEIQMLFRHFDRDGDGGIDFDEFMALLQFSPQVKGSLAAYEVSSQDQAP